MTIELLVAAFFSFVVGLAFASLFARSKGVAAVDRARAECAVELATSRENVRLQGEERGRLQAQVTDLLKEVDRWRVSLDAVSNERALFGERASRVVPLETKVDELEHGLAEAGLQTAGLRAALATAQAELQAEREAHALTGSRLESEAQSRLSAETDLAQANTQLAQLTTQQVAEREQFTEKLAFIEEAKSSLSDQFKNLANDILEEKGKRFAEQNQTTLGNLLDPLKQKLTEFQSKVEDVYVKEGKDRTALAEQVKQLMGLNQTLSDDAKNLTSALKGSNKAQGNWGELVLERVLESSGLRKGHEYLPQESHAQENGRRLQPDVVISLPEDRSLVVDSKVSLTAYEECASADNDSDREAALNRHMASIRSHIKGLSGKNYQTMYQLRSLDFVLMFIPIEPAFMLAVSNDRDLFQEAWDRNVLLVSPSTLMFVLRTVAHLWRQEAQTRNAQDIARRGAELYDRLCDFTKDLAKVGVRLRQAQDSYEDASNKLSRNKGNVIRQAEMLRDLGVKPTKQLAPALLQLTGADDVDDEVGDEREHVYPETMGAATHDESDATSDVAGEVSVERLRPGRRVNPESKLSRAREIIVAHIDSHEPRDIKRLMVELLDVSPAVANTYFCQVRNDMTDGQETVVGTEA